MSLFIDFTGIHVISTSVGYVIMESDAPSEEWYRETKGDLFSCAATHALVHCVSKGTNDRYKLRYCGHSWAEIVRRLSLTFPTFVAS
jgi:hypothetical protein